MTTPDTVLLGYEMESGRAVHIPVRHMAVTGLTQMSGKTTALEALVTRSGRRAISFVTKRREGAFTAARRIPLYFHERCDWRFVSNLLEAFLGEKVKAERVHIMRACEGCTSMRELLKTVQEKAKPQDAKAERIESPRDERAWYILATYLKDIVPEIEKLETSDKVELYPGINVMDLSALSEAVQSLIIGSVMDWIALKETNVITLVPEAWQFIPRAHGSPCKTAAIHLARKGACAGNFLWLDSQDLAAVDIEVRKMVSMYLLGVQRESNEVRRTLQHIPDSVHKPTAAEVMQLARGWFYAAWDEQTCRQPVYVQPIWLDDNPARAQRFAREQLPNSFVSREAAARAAGKRRREAASASPTADEPAGDPEFSVAVEPESGNKKESVQ